MRSKILFLLMSAALTQPVQAQTSPDNILDGLESRIDRRVDREPVVTRGVDGVSPITFSLSSPLRFTSNAAYSETNKQSSIYVDPTAEVAGEWDLEGLTLTAGLSADNQLFFSHSENDNSTLLWTGRLTAPSGNGAFYADYTGFLLFDGTFEGDPLDVHHFSVGGKLKRPLGAADTLSFDLSGTRREAELETIEFYRGTLSARWKHAIDERTSLVGLARGRLTDYTGGTASSRTDKNLLTSLTWTKVSTDQRLSFDVGVSYERNGSDVAGKDYSVWEAGPSLTYSF